MDRDTKINSDSYWNKRFSDDWECYEGPAQSRFFARLTISNLPGWLFDAIGNEKLTLVDWGCAQGDGTSEWCSKMPSAQITGVDFSEIAINDAKSRYPEIEFINQNWLDKTVTSGKYDILFSSNTLEHFHDPYDVLRKICNRSEKIIILALPYRELNRISEHFYTFSPNNIPLVLSNGYRLMWSKVIDCRNIQNSFWIGEQIVLVYVNTRWADVHNLHLENSYISNSDNAEEARRLEKTIVENGIEIEKLKEEYGRIAQDLSVVAGERDQLRDGHVDLLHQVNDLSLHVSDLSLRMDVMKNSLSWRLTKPLRIIMRVARRRSRATGGED